MIDVGIARRYVQPLFEVARENDIVNKIYSEMQELHEALSEGSSLKVILHDPSISKQSRIAVTEKVFAGFSEFSMNFIHLVIEKNRSFILEAAFSIFREVKAQAEGILSGIVESAMPLDNATVSELRLQLEKSFSQKINIECRTNPEILGGLRIRVGNTVMDGSITGKLESLRNALIGS